MADIVGTTGNDGRKLSSGALVDVLEGTDGEDKIEGKEGDDYLMGNGGADLLYGGEGNDTYVYDADINNGSDVISDDKGVNKIYITNADGATISAAKGPESAKESVFVTITKMVVDEFWGEEIEVSTTIEVTKVLKDGNFDTVNATTRQIITDDGRTLSLETLINGGTSGSGEPGGGDGYLFVSTDADNHFIGGAESGQVNEFQFDGSFGNDIIEQAAAVPNQNGITSPGGFINLMSPDVDVTGLAVERLGTDLTLTVTDTLGNLQGTITVLGFFADANLLLTNYSGNIADVQLADGSVTNLVELYETQAAEDAESGIIRGTDGADINLIGTDTADIIIGMKGDDMMKGGFGMDEYVFAQGDGHDVIADEAPEPGSGEPPVDVSLDGGFITLVNVDQASVKFVRTSLGLIVTYGTGNSIRIDGAYDEPVNGLGSYTGTISEIRFADATDPRDPDTFVYRTTVDPVELTESLVTIDLSGPLTFTGTSFNDILVGTDGNDTVNASSGADIIETGAGDDTINAGTGDDIIEAGTGFNTVDGGVGIDTATLGSEFGPAVGEVIDLTGATTAKTGSPALTSVYRNVEHVDGSRGNDYIIASSAVNWLDGGIGIDTVSYERSTAGVTVSLNDAGAVEVINSGGHAAGDQLTLFENLVGSDLTSFSDNLTGSGGANTIKGLAGNDTLNGLGGNDVLDGGAGADTLNGGAGDDRMIGGAGVDRYNGGAGNDVAVLSFNLTAGGGQTFSRGTGADIDYLLVKSSTGAVLERIHRDVEMVEYANGLNSFSTASYFGV